MIRTSFIFASMLLASAATARAQQPIDLINVSSPVNIEFMSGPIAFDAAPVTGAPYSAEAVTDVVQTLADGNRIVRQNKAHISRDSQGRTRREEGFAVFGPLVNGPNANEQRNVQISDPANGTMVMLDLRTRTAQRMPGPPRIVLRNKIAGVNSTADVNMAEPLEKNQVEKFVMFNRVQAVGGMRAEKPVVESLGTQFMEGVTVEGTRTTVTIPAGDIGNERPITIVSERWFSQDLKLLVMSRQSDPRFGETTYRLTNLNRAEPPAHLFEIPADFTLIAK
ncbi:MAG TPA: hypothetical protein VFO48_12595 [Vicinamibacterales bacterium]|nr:hypothetical protein [Vicinamibacterales bacterium]